MKDKLEMDTKISEVFFFSFIFHFFKILLFIIYLF